MGVLCSSESGIKEGDEVPVDMSKAQESSSFPHTNRRLRKMGQTTKPEVKSQPTWRSALSDGDFENFEDYEKALAGLQLEEKARAFDAESLAQASSIERKAAELVKKIKAHDWENIYGQPFDTHGYPTGKRTQGEHFLGNVDLINTTKLMNVARRMPKGGHLHIHWNSCLPAKFLIQQAREIDAMYIRSTLPLTSMKNWTNSRISFMVLTLHEATHVKDPNGKEVYVPLGNVFESSYVSNTWMSYKQFQKQFEYIDEKGHVWRKTEGAEAWLEMKMQVSEHEAHDTHQTGRGYVVWFLYLL